MELEVQEELVHGFRLSLGGGLGQRSSCFGAAKLKVLLVGRMNQNEMQSVEQSVVWRGAILEMWLYVGHRRSIFGTVMG